MSIQLHMQALQGDMNYQLLTKIPTSIHTELPPSILRFLLEQLAKSKDGQQQLIDFSNGQKP